MTRVNSLEAMSPPKQKIRYSKDGSYFFLLGGFRYEN